MLTLIILPIYLLPALVAICRGHRNALAILVLDVLLGWTLIGWVAAFIWACVVETSLQETTRLD